MCRRLLGALALSITSACGPVNINLPQGAFNTSSIAPTISQDLSNLNQQVQQQQNSNTNPPPSAPPTPPPFPSWGHGVDGAGG